MRQWQRLILAAGLSVHLWQTVVLVVPVLPSGSDFTFFFQAANSLNHGLSPYQDRTYNYPPLLAWLLKPLVPLGYLGARWIWFVLGQLAVALSAALLWRRLHVPAWILSLCLGLLSLAFRDALGLGQVGPWLLLCYTLAIIDHLGPAALAFGLGLKFLPGASLPVFAILGRWRDLGLALLAALLLTIGPTWFYPPLNIAKDNNYLLWTGVTNLFNFSASASFLRLLDWPRAASLPYRWGVSLRPMDLPLPITIGSVAIALALLLLGWALLALVPRPSLRWLLCATMAQTVIASPVAWSHYAVLYLPASALLVSHYWLLDRPRFFAALLATTGVHLIPVGVIHLYAAQFGWGRTGPAPIVLFLAALLAPCSGAVLFHLAWRIMRVPEPA